MECDNSKSSQKMKGLIVIWLTGKKDDQSVFMIKINGFQLTHNF